VDGTGAFEDGEGIRQTNEKKRRFGSSNQKNESEIAFRVFKWVWIELDDGDTEM